MRQLSMKGEKNEIGNLLKKIRLSIITINTPFKSTSNSDTS